MSDWSLKNILSSIHDDIQSKLDTARRNIVHSGAKGDESEAVWIDLLQEYLPLRYQADRAFVVDSAGSFSDQIDIVVFDRQYSPFVWKSKGSTFIPAESVYAVFEAKQSINAANIDYARRKAESVRRLHRTSLPIPHAGGTYPPKPLTRILAGILTLESDWTPPLGDPFHEALNNTNPQDRLDIGCVAAHGHFKYIEEIRSHYVSANDKPATAFLFNLISQLQSSATVPMIDVQAYAQWLRA